MGKVIYIIGTDGAGKTHVSDWLLQRLQAGGYDARKVWSRFNNYFSKPFLAATRLTGHNYYKMIDGTLFGFHDFEGLKGFKNLFAALQCIDVNLASAFKLKRIARNSDIVVCERGPWDTLVDVIADTRLLSLESNALGRLYTCQLASIETVPVLIRRSPENIFTTRPELLHDLKLPFRLEVYERLAEKHNWLVVDNNGALESTKEQLITCLRRRGIEV